MVTKEQVLKMISYVLNGDYDEEDLDKLYVHCNVEVPVVGNSAIISINTHIPEQEQKFILHIRDVAKNV